MGFPGSILLSQGDIYKETSDKRHPLGTRGYTRDGRAFRYAKSSAAITCGRVVQAATVSSLDDALSLAASTDCNTTYTTDSHTFYLSSGSSITTANCFNDGYMFVSSGSTHIGQYAQIKSSPLHSGAAGKFADVTIYPDNSYSKKLTTSCKLGLIRNAYDDVKVMANVAAGALASMTVGIAVKAISAADKYFWLQTWGPCAVITSAALALNQVFMVSSATATTGAVAKPAITTGSMTTGAIMNRQRLGQVLQVGSSSANSSALVYLMLAP